MADPLTKDELRQLPRTGILALLARCVQRVRGLYKVSPGVPRVAVDDPNVTVVRDVVAALWEHAKGDQPADLADITCDVANARGLTEEGPARDVAEAAYRACEAAVHAGDTMINYANEAIQHVATAATAGGYDICRFIRRDFDELCGMGLGAFPEPGQPVDRIQLGELHRNFDEVPPWHHP